MTSRENISTAIKVEQLDLFRQELGFTYPQASAFFDDNGIWQLIDDCYEGFHVQGAWATFEDINQCLENRKRYTC
jgi:hypothetical protein